MCTASWWSRFFPPSPSPLSLKLRTQDIQQRSATLAFQPHHSTIKSRLDLAIHTGGDIVQLVRAAKFIQCLPDDLACPLWVAGFVFVVNGQLFVSLVALL